jgi:hypothetical protein
MVMVERWGGGGGLHCASRASLSCLTGIFLISLLKAGSEFAELESSSC